VMHFFRVLIRWLIGTSKFVLISPLSIPFAHSVQQDTAAQLESR
jgi:hypothetical protein